MCSRAVRAMVCSACGPYNPIHSLFLSPDLPHHSFPCCTSLLPCFPPTSPSMSSLVLTANTLHSFRRRASSGVIRCLSTRLHSGFVELPALHVCTSCECQLLSHESPSLLLACCSTPSIWLSPFTAVWCSPPTHTLSSEAPF